MLGREDFQERGKGQEFDAGFKFFSIAVGFGHS